MGRRTAILAALAGLLLASHARPAAACDVDVFRVGNPARVTLRLDQSGRLLAGICDPTRGTTAVVRLGQDGQRDLSFAGGMLGPWRTSSPGDLTIDPRGRILVETAPSRRGEYRLRRFLSDGRVDRSFGAGTGATVIPSHPNHSSPDSIRVFAQPDGHIAVSYHAVQWGCRGAESCEYRAEYIKLHRYSPRGRLLYRQTYYAEYWEFGAAAMTANGGLVVVGDYDEGGITLLRTRPDFSLDRRFGRTGDYFLPSAGVLPEPTYFPATEAVALAARHSVLIALDQPAELRRYRANGSLDTSFGAGGRVTCVDPARDPYPAGAPFDLAEVEAGGAILAAGGSGRCGLVRYLSDGSPDPGFGTGGFIDLEALGLPHPEALAVSPTGQITIGGWDPDRGGFLVTRFSPDGQIDEGFGIAGSVLLEGATAR
ncbi:MAG TPA: hypothetical protein VNM38_11975 [Solirubrobacterales bacterium]|nr:hypothetical protein [Solirubrobacterales bacterium]